MATKKELQTNDLNYTKLLGSISELLEESRKITIRSVNTVMTATYWEIGRRIVENEQGGEARAEYGTSLLERVGKDLTKRFGRGFSSSNLLRMRRFFLTYPQDEISATTLLESSDQISATLLPKSRNLLKLHAFPLPWAHYIRLMSVDDPNVRKFYEEEAIRGGWSARQLDRQIGSQFYQRTLLSKNKLAMLEKAEKGEPFNAQEEIKSPYVLEFLDLKDEYSESELEDALIHKLQDFLLELGGDFTFVGRQRRLRIGDQWFRVDLLFFHRKLRSLVIIDLKLTEFNHADAGQMHMYLNYAREHWTHPDENPPVGLILCAKKNEAVVHYALEGLPNQVMAAEYRTTLPDEKLLAEEINKTRALLAEHMSLKDNTNEEYKNLLDLLFLGEMIASASYDEEELKKGDSPYKDICQKIYSRAAELGLDKLVDFDKETGEYWPSRYFEDTSSALDMFKEHTDESFWDELVARLAERDVCDNVGKEKRVTLDSMKFIEISHPYYERYQDEFTENGLENLRVAPKS